MKGPPVFVDTLRAACLKCGVPPDEVDASINQYLEVGTMTAQERVFLEGLVEAGHRGVALNKIRARFGSGAVPAAYAALLESVGGKEPLRRPGHNA